MPLLFLPPLRFLFKITVGVKRVYSWSNFYSSDSNLEFLLSKTFSHSFSFSSSAYASIFYLSSSSSVGIDSDLFCTDFISSTKSETIFKYSLTTSKSLVLSLERVLDRLISPNFSSSFSFKTYGPFKDTLRVRLSAFRRCFLNLVASARIASEPTP